MTQSPQEMHGVPAEEDIEAADVATRLGQDPEQVPNAPNRDPHELPDQQPGPIDPGDDKVEFPEGTESFEHPGRAGNWHAGPSDAGT
ncbi:MAG: hypothetical protein ACR2LE_08120 [Nocardioidaceae bacterium]